MPAVRDKPSIAVLVPHRRCALCDESTDVLHMTLVGKAWLCGPCFVKEDEADEDDSDPAPASVAPICTATAFRRIDATIRYSWLAVRMIGYVGLVVLAYQAPVFMHFFTGVLMADVITWGITAWFDARVHKGWHALQLGLYALMGHVWHDAGGTLALPDDMEARALAMLGFLGMFSAKAGVFGWKLMHAPD